MILLRKMLKQGVNKAKNTIWAEQQYQRNCNMNSWSSFSSALETLARLPSLSKRINLLGRKGYSTRKKYLFESYIAIFSFSSFLRLFQTFGNYLLFFIFLTVILSHGHIRPVLDGYITTPPKREEIREKKACFLSFLTAKNEKRITLEVFWIWGEELTG